MQLRNIIWLADANYRIDLDNETVRALVRIGDLETLREADQVCSHLGNHSSGLTSLL